jgi:SET domain-containing protein
MKTIVKDYFCINHCYQLNESVNLMKQRLLEEPTHLSENDNNKTKRFPLWNIMYNEMKLMFESITLCQF